MTKTYQTKHARASAPVDVVAPEAATVALTEIAGAAQEGLLALAVGVGLQVMQTMMDESMGRCCVEREWARVARAGPGDQMATASSAKAAVSRSRGLASTPSSSWPRRMFCTNACTAAGVSRSSTRG